MRFASLFTWVALAAPLVSAAAGGAGRILFSPSVTVTAQSSSHPGDYVASGLGVFVSGTPFQWKVVFDDSVAGFTDCTHCTFSSNAVFKEITGGGDGKTYYVNAYARAGDATFALGANAAHDVANTAALTSASGSPVTIPYHPTLSFSGANSHDCDNSGTVSVTIKVSHGLSTFTSDKVRVTGSSGTPSFSYNAATATATVTVHPDEADITFSVADEAFYDGPASVIGGSKTVAAACIPAVVSWATTVGAPWHDTVHAVSVTVTFAHHITELNANWISVTGGSASNVQITSNSLAYSFDVTPSGSAKMDILLPQDRVHAPSVSGGAFNPASSTFTIYSKIPLPVLDAVNNGGRHGGASGSPVYVTVSFLMPVSGFTQSDVQHSNSAITGWYPAVGSLTNMQWTIALQPSGPNNVVVYVPGGGCTNAADSTIFNTASVDLTFAYQTQVGLLALASVVPDAIVGTAPATIAITGDSPFASVTATLPVYKYAAAVTVNLVRQWDTQFASSAMSGGITVEFTNRASSAITVVISGDSQTVQTAGKFEIAWSDSELANSIRSFSVIRSDWASSAQHLLASGDTFYLSMVVKNADADALCRSNADTSGCDDNSRFFVSGVQKLVFARVASVNPPVTILSTAAYAQHFSSGAAPPPPNNGVYSQDRPFELLIFERACTADASSLDKSTQQSLWADMTYLDMSTLLVDVVGATGLNAVSKYQDVTSYFAVHTGSSNSWTSLQAGFSAASSAPTLGWQGAECGFGSRRFVLLRFVAGSAPYAISADMQSYVTITSSLLSTCASPNVCTASEDFTAPAPALIFTLHNDPTRAEQDTTVQTRTASSGFYMSSQATVGDNDMISFDVGFELMSRDVTSPVIEHQLYTVVIGDEIPVTNGRLSSAVLANRCSNIPSNFEDLLLPGQTPTTQNVYDALFGNGKYPSLSAIGSGSTYSMSDSRYRGGFEPFYPNPASSSGLFATSWKVVPFTTVGSIFYSGEESDAGRVGLKMTISGTWSQFSACMTATHNTIAVSTQDLPNGGALFNIPITVTEYIAGGTPADRIIARRAAPDTIVMTLQAPSMTTVSQASTISRGVLVTVFDVASTVVAGASSQVVHSGDYGSHFAGHMATSSTASNNVYRAIQETIVVQIPKTASSTGGDVCILPPAYTNFAPGESSCWGVLPTTGSVTYDPALATNSSMNAFKVVYQSPMINLWDSAAGAVDWNFFSTGCGGSSADQDKTIVLELMQIRIPGMSCHTALGQHLPATSYSLFRTQTITVKGALALNPAPTAFDGTSSGANWGEIVVRMYKDPNYRDKSGAWHTVNAATTPTSDTIVPLMTLPGQQPAYDPHYVEQFTNADRVAFTVQLTHNFLRQQAQMAISSLVIGEVDYSSPYAKCVDPGMKQTAGNTFQNVVCPTGADAWLNTAVDKVAWSTYAARKAVASPPVTVQNPIAQSLYLVSASKPGIEYSNGPAQGGVNLCKFDVAPPAAKEVIGTQGYYCHSNGGWDTSYYCGSNSDHFQSLVPSGQVDSTYPHLGDLTESVTENGHTVSGIVPASDAVVFDLIDFPVNKKLIYSVEAALYLCPVQGSSRRSLRADEAATKPEKDRKLAAVSMLNTLFLTSAQGNVFINFANATNNAPIHNAASGSGSDAGFNLTKMHLAGAGIGGVVLLVFACFGLWACCKGAGKLFKDS